MLLSIVAIYAGVAIAMCCICTEHEQNNDPHGDTVDIVSYGVTLGMLWPITLLVAGVGGMTWRWVK